MESSANSIRWFKENRTERSFFLVLMFLMGGNDVIGAVIEIIGSLVVIPFHLDKMLLYSVIGVVVLISMRKVISKVRTVDLAICLVMILLMLFEWFCHESYDKMYISMFFYFGYGVFAYLYFISVSDFDALINCFETLAILLSVSISLQIVLSGMSGTMSYSQYLGYALLPAAIISASSFLRRRSIVHLINFVYSTILIVSMGARWPLVCVLLFLAFRTIIVPSSLRKKILLLFALISIGFILVNYLEELLSLLGNVFSGFGLSLRTIIRIQQENFFEDSGRNDIWSFSGKTLANHLFTGVGIGNDRILIASHKGTPELASGYYPHNVFLEILLHYGVFFGSIVILVLAIYIINAFKITMQIGKKIKNYAFLDVLSITLALGVFPLLVSGSYLKWIPFYILLGLCSNILRSKKKYMSNVGSVIVDE